MKAMLVAMMLIAVPLVIVPAAAADGPECMPVYREYKVAAPGAGEIKVVQRSSCGPFEVYHNGQPLLAA